MRSPSSPVLPGRRARAVALAAAVALSIVAGACGGNSDTSSAPAAGGGAKSAEGAKAITIKDFTFSPQPLKVPKGTVVKVTNSDDAAHTATADKGTFDTGTLGQGESKEITLSEVGEIPYHCNIHDYMRGVIQVTA